MNNSEYEKLIDDVPDFPKEGVVFKDISPLLRHRFHDVITDMGKDINWDEIDLVLGVESRGFILGAALAIRYEKGFLPVRKKGKLPGKTISSTYELEYGQDALEIQENAVKRGQRVVVVDDILATGGTMGAAISLLENAGANIVTGCCIIELSFLNGRANVPAPFQSLISY